MEVTRVPSVRIFQPAKNAMQSGRANTQAWVVEFKPNDAVKPSPLMGWPGSADTRQQVRLSFDSRDDAIGYANHTDQAPVVLHLAIRSPT